MSKPTREDVEKQVECARQAQVDAVKEHDWLLIGNHDRNGLRVYEFRCKWCLEEDEAFTIDGPPKKRHMLDECKGHDFVP